MKHFMRLATITCVMTVALIGTGMDVVRADDTDIYVRNTPAPESVPLVMFTLDYRPNLGSTICTNINSGCAAAEYFREYPETAAWMEKVVDEAGGKLEYFDMLRLALHVTLSKITGVKVGLMLNNNHDNNCAGPNKSGCSNGAYVIQGIKELQQGDANGALAEFTRKLFGIPAPQGNVSHSFQGKELYFELFRYLTGQGIYNGMNGYTNFGSKDKSKNLDTEFPDAMWDTSVMHPSTKRYISPLADSNSCVGIFTINFYGGDVNQDSDSDAAIMASKASGGMEGINLSGKNNSFDTVIAYLRDANLADGTYGAAPNLSGRQGVTSYFLTGKPVKADHDRAIAGGTQRALKLTENPEEMVKILTDIFNEILSVSTTFVAASVPVNVFNRAESLDNVFIALFQAEKEPFWAGNLKKLKLAVVTETDGSKRVELQDKNKRPAIALDGRIKYDALTYWTVADKLPEPVEDSDEVALRDGRVVARGAAGQKIPGFIDNNIGLTNGLATAEPSGEGPRKVLYNDASDTLVALNADSATATALKNHFDTADHDTLDLIKWLRGIDPTTGSKRDWILGDPLHSRPLPINYGKVGSHDEENPLIYIAMASNDGYMHFFRNTDGGGGELGKEVWAFVPTEIMDKVPLLMDNTPTDPKHPYTVDGAPAAFVMDKDGNGTIDGDDKVYLYFGLRRGGKVMYALDVTKPNAPELAWKITKTSGGDFDELGDTWSRPQTGYVNYDGTGRKPVVIFSAGYDTNKDKRAGAAGTNDSEGNAIYIVDAEKGTLIWKTTKGASTGSAGTKVYTHEKMVDSIPSDVTIVDTDGDGLVDRIVVGDTGGRVWRVDTYGERSNWQTTLLASVGRHANSGTLNDRRFFHKPDFVQAQEEIKDSDGNLVGISKFDAVILGSGNRPNPLDKEYSTLPMNWLYMIKDYQLMPAKASPAPADEVQDLDYQHDDLGDITNPATGTVTNAGWKLKLDVGAGEKSLSSPLTLSNTIYFTTYLPKGTYTDEIADETEPATCGPSEGSGLLYAVKLHDGRAANNYNTADDGADGENTSAEDRYKELASAGIPADVVGLNLDGQAYVLPPDLTPEAAPASSRWRSFWYEVENGF